jgi:hypothetical protein
MISIEQQQRLLLSAARRLKRKITAYAIGGTSMMFLGLKDSTLDIDLVFKNKKDKDTLKEAIKSIGYHNFNPIKVYGKKENQPEMLTLGDERFDLFVLRVIYFIFSDTMQKRAKHIHQFDKNLILKIADPHDIILMKCATDRLKDVDDVKRIINNTKIDWNIIVEEAEKQINLGQEKAAFELGCFLEDLREKMKVNIPKETLDKLFKIVQKQAAEKQK